MARLSRVVLLGLVLFAVVVVAADEGAAEKPAEAKPAEAKTEAKADVPAGEAKKDAGAKLAAKESADASAGGEKPSATSGASKQKPDPTKYQSSAGKAKTAEERKTYAKMTPDERRAEREARMSERDKTREAKMEERRKTKQESIEKAKTDHEDRRKKMEQGGTQTKPNRAGAEHHMMNEFRGTAGLFMALVAPVKPAKVTFPLDDDTRLKFSAARDGLMKSVRKQGADLNVKDEATKKDLRAKTRSNQEKTLDILLEAVKSGMTVQEARMGMVIAQFEALDDSTKKEALEKAKQRQERMPSGARAKMNERLELKNKKERDQLTALKTEKEKEDFVKRIYRPRYNMATA